MSVRQSLLAILDQGPCYGYQLRAEFDRRTGSTWPLNVGQIYNTLERLERDGLVAKGEVDEHGHVYYRITDAGTAEVRMWLNSPVTRTAATREELPLKLALAATLPGVDAREIIRQQHAVSLAALDRLRAASVGITIDAGSAVDADRAVDAGSAVDADVPPRPDGEELARRLVADALVFQAEAEVRWLEHVASTLSPHTPHAFGLELNAERPRRGRPPRSALTQAG